MLGGRKHWQTEIDNLDAKLNSVLTRLRDLEELLKYVSERQDMNIEVALDKEPVVDKYAKMRTSDGLFSYQTYKARKAGLGGE